MPNVPNLQPNTQRPVALYGFTRDGSTSSRIDVFWCATDQTSIVHTWSNDGTTWQAAIIAESNGPFGLAPAIYSDQPGKMDIGWTDADYRIWYMSWTGSGWTSPLQLNPEAMTASQGWKPQNFGPQSPLVACATPLNRRSANTEFLICSGDLRTWSLSTDGSTWFVAGGQQCRLLYPPMQVKMATTPGGTPVLCQFACSSIDTILRVTSGEIPDGFDESTDFPQGAAAAEETVFDNGNPLMPGWASLGGQPSYLATLNNALGNPMSRFRALLPQLNSGVYDANWPRPRPEVMEFAQLHPAGSSPGAHDDERRLDRLMFEDYSRGTIVTTPLKYAAFFGPVRLAPALLARALPSGHCVDLVYFDVHDLWHVRWLNGNEAIQSITHSATGLEWDFVAPLPIGGSGGLHVLWSRRSDGAIMDTFEGPTGGWTTSAVATVPGASSPGGAVDAQGGVHAFWIGTGGRLYTASGTGGTWQAPALTPVPGNFPVANTAYVIKSVWNDVQAASNLASFDGGDRVSLSSGNGSTAPGQAPPQWRFEQTSPNVFHIKATTPVQRGAFLSCNSGDLGVNMYWEDDHSGRQKWQLQPTGDPALFTIAVFDGTTSGTNLTAYHGGLVRLGDPTPPPPGSLPPQQLWRIEPTS